MGLQSQLNDVSSDSLPFLLLSLLATFVSYIRSFSSSSSSSSSSAAVKSIRAPFTSEDHDNEDDEDTADGNDDKCVFCLSGLRQGDRVRKLTCRHVFHTDCLDGWIGQMKSSCPLCRSPLPTHSWRVDRPCRRVLSHLHSWFAVR